MPVRKRALLESLSVRFAARRDQRTSRLILRSKRGMTLLLGAALSFGGITQSFEGVHFLVEKDLDAVRVVKQSRDGESVVANVGGAFAANSLYKLSGVAPDSLVSRRSSLFDSTWLGRSAADVADEAIGLGDGIAMFNDELRERFFSSSMPYGQLIHEKAEKYDVDPALVAAVIEAESRFKHRAQSPVGARGLMQLMPRTGRWMGARNLYDPAQNVDAGVKYLKYLDKRFDGNLTKTIAAYNAGEGNVRKFGGVPPYRETRTYVKRVMKNYNKRKEQLDTFREKTAPIAENDVAATQAR
jgi:soluble lytic murein transglycosylase-like protein